MPPADPLQLTAGLCPVEGYALVRVLGRGAFGEVWLASAPGGFEVAMKFVRLGNSAGAIEQHALDGIKKVRHGNLLPMFGAWPVSDCLVIAMELANGTLLDRLNECQSQGREGIPHDELLGYMAEAAKGIDYLNEPRHTGPDGRLIRIVHRDIKPQNLLLVGTTCKVADFGLAKFMEHTVTITQSYSMTPAYAAPEFFNQQVSAASDQYSLAVAYCQLRGGRLPFVGNLAQLVNAHLNLPPQLDMLPSSEREVVKRALAKKPEERWPSCQEFVRALATPAFWIAPIGDVTLETGGAVAVDVRVERRNLPGPIHLRAGGLPTGVTGSQGLIPQGEDAGTVRLSASEDAAEGVYPVNLEARAAGAARRRTFPLTVQGGKEVTNSIGMRLVLVQPGSFLMGSPKTDPDAQDDEFVDKAKGQYQHRVTITKSFHVGKYQVTRGQFRQFVEATGHVTDQEKRTKFTFQGQEYTDGWGLNAETGNWKFNSKVSWKSTGYPQEEDHPVVLVSHADAKAFCAWLSEKEGRNYRLLFEAEWEYCARAGETTRYPGGDDPEVLVKVGNVADASAKKRFPDWTTIQGDDGYVFTAPVGKFAANRFGLHDMIGNVWEWCEDWYDHKYYGSQEQWEDPEGPGAGAFRVFRGGSFGFVPRFARLAFRIGRAPLYRSGYVGFRVVRVR